MVVRVRAAVRANLARLYEVDESGDVIVTRGGSVRTLISMKASSVAPAVSTTCRVMWIKIET